MLQKTLLMHAALLLTLTSCNTFEGIGKDMQSAGESLANTSNKVKKKINKEDEQQQPQATQSYRDNPSASY